MGDIRAACWKQNTGASSRCCPAGRGRCWTCVHNLQAARALATNTLSHGLPEQRHACLRHAEATTTPTGAIEVMRRAYRHLAAAAGLESARACSPAALAENRPRTVRAMRQCGDALNQTWRLATSLAGENDRTTVFGLVLAPWPG